MGLDSNYTNRYVSDNEVRMHQHRDETSTTNTIIGTLRFQTSVRIIESGFLFLVLRLAFDLPMTRLKPY